MTHPKPSPSSLRYFIASLKSLGRPRVWGSVGIIALVGFSIWQYSQHPEWLSGELPLSNTNESGEASGNNLDIGVNVEDLEANLSNTPIPPDPFSPNLGQPSEELPLDNLNAPVDLSELQTPLLPQEGVDPIEQTTSEQGLDKAGQKPSIKFQPLIPSFKNLGSLFPAITPDKNASKPIELPPLEPINPTTPENHPLKKALENVGNPESSVNPVEKIPVPEEPNVPEPSLERQPSINNQPPAVTRRTLPTTPRPQSRNNPYSGNQNYPRPYNNPYSGNQNYPRPYNNPYSSNQNYPQPYSNPIQPYNNPYGNGAAPAPTPVYPQPSQPSNTPNRNLNPNPYPQSNQAPNRNNYGMQPPQVDAYEGQYSY